jgi:hypothetical protein
MKSIKQLTSNKFSKGFNNILSPTLLNLIILLSLIIILALVYLKTNKFELFDCITNPTDPACSTTTTKYKTTIPNITLSTNDIDTNYFATIINNYIKSKSNNNEYQNILNQREQTIQTLANNINNIF